MKHMLYGKPANTDLIDFMGGGGGGGGGESVHFVKVETQNQETSTSERVGYGWSLQRCVFTKKF